MPDVIEKSLLAALGAFEVSRSKVKEMVDFLVEKGKLSRGEAPKFVDEFLKRCEKESEGIKKCVEGIPWIATRKDLDEILKRLDAIEARLSSQGK
jgi:polyhydroxyalkanoate synthesis regulator phasin